MTGAEFAAAGQALALAYAQLRPGGAAWLANWRADDPDAADELMEWELEGHPWSGRLNLLAPISRHRRTIMTTPVATADTVAAVLTLLQTPEAWCQGAGARNAAGEPVEPESPEAVAWSIDGAVLRVGGGEAVEDRLLQVLRTEFDRPALVCLAQFNDGRFTDHAEVLGVLSSARM